LQPFTHFVADRPASLVVDLDVIRGSAVEFHFAYISIGPHETLSRQGRKMFRVIDCASRKAGIKKCRSFAAVARPLIVPNRVGVGGFVAATT
jgi:hypothetical protein